MKTQDIKSFIVKCPNCAYEYLAGELFVPNAFIGQPKYIDRDISGKIVDWEGLDPTLDETFKCEHCGKEFRVHASVDFYTKPSESISTDYVSEKYSDRLFLSED